MNSEKVKEIKKALYSWQESVMISTDENYVSHKVYNREILDYINELESENERLLESCKNCHYIKDLEIANGHAKELKDQIAELEKENTRLNKLFTYDKLVRDRCFEFIKDIKEKALKQFAERLKEKCKERYILLHNHICFGDIEFEINKTLNEFINKGDDRQ